MNLKRIICSVWDCDWEVHHNEQAMLPARTCRRCGKHIDELKWPKLPPMPKVKPSEPNRDIAVLSVKETDTVVLSYPGALSKEARDEIKRSAESALPRGVKVLILEGGVTLAAVLKRRQEGESAAQAGWARGGWVPADAWDASELRR